MTIIFNHRDLIFFISEDETARVTFARTGSTVEVTREFAVEQMINSLERDGYLQPLQKSK